MNSEDEEFNRIERESDMRRKAVSVALKDYQEHMLQHMSEYERGFIDGMQKQAQSSVDRAVNAMTQPTYFIPNKDGLPWAGLTDEEVGYLSDFAYANDEEFVRNVEAKLKEKNNG
jgi:ribosomal protein S8